MKEARTAGVERLHCFGTMSLVMINGRGRNTSDILEAANPISGAPHVSFPSDKPVRVYAGADVRHCENPSLAAADKQTERFDHKYVARQSSVRDMKFPDRSLVLENRR